MRSYPVVNGIQQVPVSFSVKAKLCNSINMKIFIQKAIHCCQQQHVRYRPEVPHSFTFYKFPDSFAWFDEQLLCSIENAFIKMKKAMLYIMPQKMKVHGMGIGRLATVSTKFSFKLMVAIFAGS
jgi:hypothetical protein